MTEMRPLHEGEYDDCADLLAGSVYYSSVRYRDIVGCPMLGVFDKGTIVGCAMVLIGGPQSYVDYLFIHPLYQRGGLGIKFVRHIVADLKAQGVLKIHACVSSNNGTMQRIITKMFKHEMGWPYTNFVVDVEENNG